MQDKHWAGPSFPGKYVGKTDHFISNKIYLLFCMLWYDLTGETGHHVQDVIIELFRKPKAMRKFMYLSCWSFIPPVFSGSMQCVGSCQMLNHCLDHQLKEEPGAVSDGLPGRVAGQGELESQLLVHKLPKARRSKCCKCTKVSSCAQSSIEWNVIDQPLPIYWNVYFCTFWQNQNLTNSHVLDIHSLCRSFWFTTSIGINS